MEKIERLKIYIIGGPAGELAIKWNEILQNVIKGNKIPMYQNIGIDTDFLGKHAENIEIVSLIDSNDINSFVYDERVNGIVLLSDVLYSENELNAYGLSLECLTENSNWLLSELAARLIPLINQHRVVLIGYNGTKKLEKLEEIIKDYMTEENNPCFYSNCSQKNLLINPQVSSMRAFSFLLDNIIKRIINSPEHFDLQEPSTGLDYAPTSEIERKLKTNL